MIGRAGSHGPCISFLYLWSPINHQLHPPIARPAMRFPSVIPTTAAFHPPRVTTIPTPPPAPITRSAVRATCQRQDTWRKCLRKTGNSPKTSIEKSVREKTCWVDGSREASTVDAMRAAFVEREA